MFPLLSSAVGGTGPGGFVAGSCRNPCAPSSALSARLTVSVGKGDPRKASGANSRRTQRSTSARIVRQLGSPCLDRRSSGLEAGRSFRARFPRLATPRRLSQQKEPDPWGQASVGAPRFELGTSCSQSRRAGRTALRPDHRISPLSASSSNTRAASRKAFPR
jgi:hypothetical protein